MARTIRITHKPSNTLLAEGPLGWGITPFEGNYYVRRQYLKTDGFKINYLPGLCIYKFFYVWMNLVINGKTMEKNIAWLYWLPNPLLPFIWFRTAIPGGEASLDYELVESA